MLKFYFEIFYNFRGSFLGIWFKFVDYYDESVKEIDLKSFVDLINCNGDLGKCVKDVVKSEFQKYRKENEEISDFQIYKKGEVE